MNYLTNYYKNLSEQLQEQVNHLEALLAEANTRLVDVGDVEHVGQGEYTIVGKIADGKGKGAQKTRGVYFEPEIGRPMSDYHNAARIGAEPIEVPENELNYEPHSKGHHVHGRGKKSIKKALAVAKAKREQQ